MDWGEYVDMIFQAALRPEEPSMDALDEAIAIVEKAIENLEKEGEQLDRIG